METVTDANSEKPNLPIAWRIVIGVLFFGIISVGATLYMADGPDWHRHYYPAGVAFWEGRNFYFLEHNYPNPPWMIAFIAPLALLPMQVGRGIWFAMGFVAYGFVAYRLGARGVGLVAFIISPPVLHGLLNANVDWIVLLGAVLPAQWGLLLLSVKPQVGAFAGLLVLYEQWQEAGWQGVVKALTPTVLLTIAFVFVYGLWFLEIIGDGSRMASSTRNDTLYPYSIPFGLMALYMTWKRKDIGWAFAAGPLLFPYASFHSYVALLMPFCKSQKLMILVVSIFWLLVLRTLLVVGI